MVPRKPIEELLVSEVADTVLRYRKQPTLTKDEIDWLIRAAEVLALSIQRTDATHGRRQAEEIELGRLQSENFATLRAVLESKDWRLVNRTMMRLVALLEERVEVPDSLKEIIAQLRAWGYSSNVMDSRHFEPEVNQLLITYEQTKKPEPGVWLLHLALMTVGKFSHRPQIHGQWAVVDVLLRRIRAGLAEVSRPDKVVEELIEKALIEPKP